MELMQTSDLVVIVSSRFLFPFPPPEHLVEAEEDGDATVHHVNARQDEYEDVELMKTFQGDDVHLALQTHSIGSCHLYA